MRRLLLLVAVLAAGCGTSPPPPTLAAELAQRADDVRVRLERRDPCGAHRLAVALQRRTVAVIGRVRPRYEETLMGTVNDLADRIRCGWSDYPGGGGSDDDGTLSPTRIPRGASAAAEARNLAAWLRRYAVTK